MLRILLLLIGLLWASFSWAQANLPLSTIAEQLSTKKKLSLGQLDEALGPFKRDTTAMLWLVAWANKTKNKPLASYALNSLGVQARNKSKFEQSLQLHRQALQLAEEIRDTDLRVTSLNMLGVTYRRMDAVRSSLDYHKAALELAEKATDQSETILKSTAVALNSIGNIYLTLKQYELGEQQFSRALTVEEKVGNKLGLAINYQNLGYVHEAQGQLDEALASYRKSYQFNQEINSTLGLMICDNSIGQVYLKQNKPKEGLRLIQPTIQIAQELGDQFYIAMAHINAGWALTSIGDYLVAEEYLKKGLTVALEHGLQTSIADAYLRLSDLSEKQGNFANALAYLKNYQDYQEKILNEKNLQYTADLIIKYDSEKKQNQIQLLEKENEIVKIKLFQNRRLLIAFLLVSALVLGLFYILYRQYKLKNEKNVLSLQQQMMRAQMNPHFLFNSLNSIKLYIINNDKEKAVYFLNKFAKLIRTILASSTEKEVSLHEELETMDLYVTIENIRFSNKILYEVHLSKELSPKEIKIPSFVLQPFIENSIWHGLSTKEGEKRITLAISKQDERHLQIQITDNGIGREQAKALNKNKVMKQKSVGIDITKERLNNFAKNFKGNFQLQFDDLKDAQGTPLGTQVRLIIPLQ